jgi:hypothetical protein
MSGLPVRVERVGSQDVRVDLPGGSSVTLCQHGAKLLAERLIVAAGPQACDGTRHHTDSTHLAESWGPGDSLGPSTAYYYADSDQLVWLQTNRAYRTDRLQPYLAALRALQDDTVVGVEVGRAASVLSAHLDGEEAGTILLSDLIAQARQLGDAPDDPPRDVLYGQLDILISGVQLGQSEVDRLVAALPG